MTRRALSNFAGVLGLVGVAASSVALLAVLGKTLKLTELSLSVLSAIAGLLSGLFSPYVARAAKKLRLAPRVFMSYSHDDQPTATQVAEALRAHGARVWLDVERLKPGDSILQAVEKAIEDADTFVVLLSRQPSPNLALELGLARAKGVRIVPVLLSGTKVPSDLAGIRYVDLRQRQPEALKELVAAAT